MKAFTIILSLILANLTFILCQTSNNGAVYKSLKNLDKDYDYCSDICSSIYNFSVCNENGDIVCLNLSKMGLKEIPKEITNFEKLRVLVLQENQISTVPSFLLDFKYLRELNLSFNRLTEVNDVITNLNLSFLTLKGNLLTKIPPSIGKLTDLTKIIIGDNQITELPEEFLNLTKLDYLTITRNNITHLPEEFGKLSKLKYLYMNYIPLEYIPASIGNLSDLLEITVRNTTLTELPNEIYKLKNLITIDIGDCEYLKVKMVKFSNNLQKCIFGNTKIECYQPESCKLINSITTGALDNFDDYRPESDYVDKYPACSTEFINFIQKNYINNGNTSGNGNANANDNNSILSNDFTKVGLCIGLLLMLGVIGYISFSLGSKKKNSRNKSKEDGDVVYEKKLLTKLPKELQQNKNLKLAEENKLLNSLENNKDFNLFINDDLHHHHNNDINNNNNNGSNTNNNTNNNNNNTNNNDNNSSSSSSSNNTHSDDVDHHPSHQYNITIDTFNNNNNNTDNNNEATEVVISPAIPNYQEHYLDPYQYQLNHKEKEKLASFVPTAEVVQEENPLPPYSTD